MPVAVRVRVTTLILLGFILLSACAPEKVTIVYNTLTPTDPASAPTATATLDVPSWERTPTPKVIDPNQPTPTPTPITPTPTQPPRPELETYMPTLNEVALCDTVSYNIGIATASMSCPLKAGGSMTVTWAVNEKKYSVTSLAMPNGYRPVNFPLVASGSNAGINETETGMLALFYQSNVLVTINYSVSGFAKLKKDLLVEMSRAVDAKLPSGYIWAPLELSFPEKAQLDKRREFFNNVVFSIYSGSVYYAGPAFPKDGRVCVYVEPMKTDRNQMWTVVLYDELTETITKKMEFGMFAQRVCPGLEPKYGAFEFKGGDRYEVRVAVGNTWVATFPMITKE